MEKQELSAVTQSFFFSLVLGLSSTNHLYYSQSASRVTHTFLHAASDTSGRKCKHTDVSSS